MAVWVSILAQLAKYIYLKIRITTFNMAIQKQFSIKLIYMQGTIIYPWVTLSFITYTTFFFLSLHSPFFNLIFHWFFWCILCNSAPFP